MRICQQIELHFMIDLNTFWIKTIQRLVRKTLSLLFSDLLLFLYVLFTGFITREHGERVFNRLNRYSQSVFLILLFHFSFIECIPHFLF